MGVFLLLWALLALTLTLAASGGGLFGQGVYGLLFVALLLLGIGALADNGGLAKAAWLGGGRRRSDRLVRRHGGRRRVADLPGPRGPWGRGRELTVGHRGK